MKSIVKESAPRTFIVYARHMSDGKSKKTVNWTMSEKDLVGLFSNPLYNKSIVKPQGKSVKDVILYLVRYQRAAKFILLEKNLVFIVDQASNSEFDPEEELNELEKEVVSESGSTSKTLKLPKECEIVGKDKSPFDKKTYLRVRMKGKKETGWTVLLTVSKENGFDDLEEFAKTWPVWVYEEELHVIDGAFDNTNLKSVED